MTFGCNGRVHSIATGPDGRIALGGTFSLCGNVPASNVVIYDPVQNEWSSLGDGITTTPGGATRVLALEWFRGDLYVGGEFVKAGAIEAHDLARWDGSQWHSLGVTGLNSSVNALAADTNFVYVGGSVGFGGVKRWDGNTLTSIDGELGTVNALALNDQSLFVGGSFSSAGGVQARNIARWDGANWHSLGSGSTNGTLGAVNAIAIDGNDVYVGGDFSLLAGGATARRVARWDGNAWHSLEENGVNGVNNRVTRLAIHQGMLLVGGFFSKAGEHDAGGLATWNGSGWTPVPAAPGGVWAMAISGDRVYAGGDFREVANTVVENVARYSGESWSGIGSGPGAGVNGQVDGFAWSGNTLYLAGSFRLADGKIARGLATLRDGSFQPFADSYGRFYSLAVSGADVYVGGRFAAIGSTEFTNIAHWNGSEWRSLSSGLGVAGSDAVHALVFWRGELYAAGTFASADGLPANNLARWNGLRWEAMNVGIYAAGSVVRALAATNDFLYVGGDFQAAGGVSVSNIARWDGNTWSNLAGGANASVTAMLPSGSDLFVGGSFTTVGGLSSSGIARWDGSAWHALGSGLQPTPGVSALAQGDGVIYVGGRFNTAGQVAANNVAQWDGSHWYSAGHGFDNGTENGVSALLVADQTLHVGGDLKRAGGKLSTGYAQWKISAPLLFSAGFEPKPVP